MKTIVKILCLLVLSITTAFAQEKMGQDVVVNISNLSSDNGKVFVALYSSEKDFLNKGMRSKQVKSVDKACSVTFSNIPEGVYAISLFHDENDNKIMDKNSFGAPKEAYGCSNNAKGFFGPPKWEDAKFEITNSTITQNIKL